NFGSSVFLVELDKVAREDRPAEFRDLIGYRFWVQDKEGEPPRTLGMPAPNLEEQAYYDWLNRLSYELAAEIKKLHLQNGSASALPDQPSGPIVFLAEATDDLDELRESVKNHLQQVGLQVLPKTWYSHDDPAAFQQSTERDLQRFSVE